MLKFLYLLTLFGAVLTLGFLLWRGRRRSVNAEGSFFSAVLLTAGFWGAAKMMQALSPGLDLQVIWNKAAYLGVTTLPIFWFFYVAFYTETLRNWQPIYALAFGPPLLTFGLLLTNAWHHLVWRSASLASNGAFVFLELDYGSWFNLVHLPYSYTAILLSFFCLARGFVVFQRARRLQLHVLALASMPPVILNLAYLADLVPGGFDFTPVGFALSGLTVVAGASRFGLLQHVPLRQGELFGRFQSPAFVLDKSFTVLELNDNAAELMGLPVTQLMGRSLLKHFPFDKAFWLELLRADESLERRFGGRTLRFNLKPFRQSGQTRALILSLRDVSLERAAASAMNAQLGRLKAVVETSERLRNLNYPEQVYEEALRVVLELTQADFANLLLLKGDVLEVAASRRAAGSAWGNITRLEKGKGLSWQVVAAKETVLLHHPAGLPAARPEGEPAPKSFVGTLIESEQGEPLGVLTASLDTAEVVLGEADAAFLEAIALAVGSAMTRIMMLEEAKRKASEYRDLYTEAERQARELSLLDRVRTAVARELDLREVIRSTTHAITDILGYSLVSLYLLDADAQVLELQYQQGYPDILKRVPITEGVIGRVARTGQAILLADPVARPELHGTLEGATSEVAVPIFDHANVAGVLNIETIGEQKLNQTDLQLMMNLSEQVSVAVERARLYGKMQANEQRLSMLAENMSDLICLHPPGGGFHYVTPSCESVLGFTPEELLGKALGELIHPQDFPFLQKTVFERLLAGQEVRPFTFRIRQKEGEYVWLESFVQLIRDEADEVSYFLSASRDVTERKYMQEQMIEGALLYDALTNLPNRALFMDRLQQALKSDEGDPGFAVLFLDLDRFKVINDSLGHSAGDALLVEASRRLQTCVRPHDTVARLGGDEFAVLLEGTSETDATELAGRLQLELAKPFMLDGHTVFSSASIGITLHGTGGQDASDPEQLLRNADLAMYHAKTSGKARYALFDRAMHRRMAELMSLETDLRQVVEQNGLHVVYQPMIDLATGNLSGFEALVRWNHETRGAVPPSTFIPIAEEMGLISQIDNFVLAEACRQLASWQQHFGLDRRLSMSANLSTKNFVLSDLAERIGSVLEQTQVAPQQLKLEITESVLVDNAEVGAGLLSELRAMGVALQIDDFGTGYSSLSYLHKLPLDSLKIDRSFVNNLSRHDDAIIRTIISLARSLDLDVVAEGIETHEQLEQLMQLGCDYGQGYLFAEPLLAAEVEKQFLTKQPGTPVAVGLS